MSLATPLSHGASPGPLNAASPPNNAPELDRTTWQREMERAMSASWFRFDDAAPSSDPAPPARPAAAGASASTPTPRVTPARTASAQSAAKSHAAPKNGAPARNDDGTTAAAPQSIAHAEPGAQARGALAPAVAMPVTGATLPASIAAITPPVAKQLPAAPLPPDAQGRAPTAPASRVESLAALLAAALAAAPQAGIASGATTEEPAQPAPAPAPAQEIPPALRDLFGPLPGEVFPNDAADTKEASAARAPRDEAADAEPAPPLRWHAEWDEQGVRVWLGLDSAAGIDAPQLAQQVLQSLGGQGVRVLSLICNGKPLYGTPRDPNPQSDRKER